MGIIKYNPDLLRLELSNQKFLRSVQNALAERFGIDLSNRIIMHSTISFPLIIQYIPKDESKLFKKIIITYCHIISLKKAMQKNNIGVKEFVHFILGIFDSNKKHIHSTIVNKITFRIDQCFNSSRSESSVYHFLIITGETDLLPYHQFISCKIVISMGLKPENAKYI